MTFSKLRLQVGYRSAKTRTKKRRCAESKPEPQMEKELKAKNSTEGVWSSCLIEWTAWKQFAGNIVYPHRGAFFGRGGGVIMTKTGRRCQFQVNVIPFRDFHSPSFSLREGAKKKFDTASSRGLLLQPYQCFDDEIKSFDIAMTMLMLGKIDEDTVDCRQLVAFKGASHEDRSSTFNLGQLTKRIDRESDEFDEE